MASQAQESSIGGKAELVSSSLQSVLGRFAMGVEKALQEATVICDARVGAAHPGVPQASADEKAVVEGRLHGYKMVSHLPQQNKGLLPCPCQGSIQNAFIVPTGGGGMGCSGRAEQDCGADGDDPSSTIGRSRSRNCLPRRSKPAEDTEERAPENSLPGTWLDSLLGQ